MRSKTINIYKFDELSEKAQRYAWENSPGFDFGFDCEYKQTLKEFEKIFDIKVYRYDVGGCYCPSFAYVKAGDAVGAPENDPLRLARYMWNNYAEYIQKRRYYSKGRYINGKYTYKYRHSKIQKTMVDLPLTGFCADYDILKPVIECLEYKRFYDSIGDLYDDCLHSFFNAWNAEIEYCQTFEYFTEMAEINDCEFLENGEWYQ